METEEALLEADISGSEDEGDDERKHNQLVDAISSLDGKNKHKLSQRTVLTNQVSEFNFATSGAGASKVKVHELVGSLKDTAKLGNIKRQLNIVNKKKKVVSTPLPKHEKQKIDRSLAYENTKQDIAKWDSVVSKNRLAEQLQFPLQKPDLKLATIDDFVKRFELRTPLEVQVAALLRGSDHVVQDKKQNLTPAEQRALRAMDIQEAKQRHAELMKHKALLSYQEAKARWRNKIKSKRYHRILKKTRLKQEKKALDELEKRDPEGFAEKLKLLEKDRIQERMSLKHRGGSKYARKQMIYAKYDDKAREQVQDMLQKSRELTKKLEVESDSDESGGGVTPDEDEVTSEIPMESGGNPWMKTTRPAKKDNPWMAKPEATSKSDYARPEAYKTSVEVENISSIEDNTHVDSIVSDEETMKKTGNGVIDSDSEDQMSGFTSQTKDSETSSEDDDNENDHDGDFDDVSTKDDIDRIFSNASKKSKFTKLNEKEGMGKGKGKRKEKIFKEDKNDVIQRDEVDSDIKDLNKRKDSDQSKPHNDDNENCNDDDDDEGLISEGLNRKRTLEEIEISDSDEDVDKPKKGRKDHGKEEEKERKIVEKEVFVDPKKLFTLDSKLKQVGTGPSLVDNDEDDLDPDEQQRMTIAQAFADDDVIEEFQRDKEADIDKNKPKDIDLTLPGWGEWGGAGIKVSKRKKRRFRIRAPPAAPRRDMHLGNVIISEKKASAATKHQVNELPYPFVDTEQFEKSIRAPLGKTWNPEIAFQELVKPKVVTKLGKIIMPIDKSEVYKNANKKSESKRDGKFNEPRKKMETGRTADIQRGNYNRGDSRKKHVKDKNPGRKKTR